MMDQVKEQLGKIYRSKEEATMINFEEEIKKFHPSLEIEEAENAIYNNNISDITDVMIQMVEELKGENK